MKIITALVRKSAFFAWIFFAVMITGTDLMAAEDVGSWRPTYDVVMKWVNFIIFSALIFKIGKKPIAGFITGRKFDIETQIHRLEKEKQDLQLQTEETMKTLSNTRESFQEISEKIINEGEKERLSIIEEATRLSQFMIEEAKHKIQVQIMSAEKNFKSELIDASIEIALKKIKDHVTPEDDERFLKQYFTAISSS